MYYYHIPAQSGCDLPMYPVFAAGSSVIPTLAGVKYVSGDTNDFFECQRDFGGAKGYNFMWANEPKLQGLGLGMASSVVSQSYYVPSWNRLWEAWIAGDLITAQHEQSWKNAIGQITG